MTLFPLFPSGAFGHYEGHVLGILFGMAFGFVLERAGFGRASNLAAQFYGGDNRVLKVMFTGIATTTVSLGALSALGLLDLGAITVPETFLGPQLVGGLLLGAGFVIAGYCPGTGVVAAASGSLDGLLSYVGVMFGTIVFGLAWPALAGFYGSGGMGSVRFDQWLGVPFPVLAAGVLVMAAGAFLGAERLEAWLAGRRGTAAPDVAPRLRNVALGAITAVAVLGLLPSAASPAVASPRDVPTIGAEALADALIAEPRALWVVDLRDPAACAAQTVPGATCRPADDKDSRFVADLPATRTLVVVADAGQVLPAAVTAWPGEVRTLDGGAPAFAAAALTAPVAPVDPTAADVAAYTHRAAVYAYFSGAPASAPTVGVRKAAAGPVAKKGGGC